MTKTKRRIKCSWCKQWLSDEERESPRKDPDGKKPCCDECYHEHFEFTCCCCCNYGDNEDQHNMLVVFQECSSMGGPSREVFPGVYKVNVGPYHGSCMIGSGWLYSDKLERIADLNPGMDGEGYPFGHLCLECQGHVAAQFSDRCVKCKTDKASCLAVTLGSWNDFKAKKWQTTKTLVVCADCRHAHKGSWKMVKQ